MRLAFGEFEFDPDDRRLLRRGAEVPLEGRCLDLLRYLIEHPGRLISKAELVANVWHARALSDGALSSKVAKLRRALGQEPSDRVPIETVYGHGYRWHVIAQPQHAQVDHVDTGPTVPARDPLIGRSQDMQVLSAALEEAAQGHGKLVVVRGEAGIGKTRMLAELARHAGTLGFRVWRGAADDSGGAPAYWPWTEVLRACRADLSEPIWTQHRPARCLALPALVPELFPGASHDERPDARSLRFLLFDELTRFLRSVTANTACLIVVEDLHWADTATVELLAYAARNLGDQHLLLAASWREPVSMLDESHGAALRRLARSATRVALRGLSAEEIRELIGTLHGVQLSAQALRLLEQRTHGNPFVVRQILELLIDRGQTPNETTLAAVEVPPAVHDIIRQRLAPLPDTARTLLPVAAAIGQTFDPWLLAAAVGAPIAQTLSALEPALHTGLLARDGALLPRFRFEHSLVRDALYEELSLTERGALHAKLARALTLRDEPRDARQLAEIAHHFSCAVPADLDACVLHCCRAADAAREASGFEAAADLLARLLQKLTLEGGADATRCELMLALGTDRYRAGDLEGAWQTLQRGAELAQRDHYPPLLASIAFRMLDCVESGYGDETHVRALLEDALRTLPDRHTGVRAALLARRARLAHELPFAERVALLDEADALASSSDAADLQLEILTSRASVRDPTQLEHSREAARRLRALLAHQPHGFRGTRVMLCTLSGIMTEYLCALTSCDLEAADGWLRRATDVAGVYPVGDLQPMQMRLVLALMLAGRALGDGRFDELEQRIASLRELGSSLSGWAALAWVFYSCLLADARDDQQTLRNLAALSVPGLQGQSRQRLYATILASWLCAKAGRRDRARDFLASIPAAELARMPVGYGDLGLLCMLAEAYHALDQVQGAESLYRQLAPHAGLNAVGPCFEYRGSVAYYVGILASLLGDIPEANQSFERARVMNTKLKMPVHLARTHALLQGRATDAQA